MLTYKDCLGLAGLTEEEISAVAAHEHLPEMVALELAQYLVQCPDGDLQLRRIILDDIEHAERCGHADRAAHLRLVLRHFVATHPHRRRPVPPKAPAA